MPAHSQLAQVLTYAHDAVLPAGSLVRVPFGKREVLGIVWSDEASEPSAASAPEKIKAISAVLPDLAPLSATWRALVSFAARYYQRSLGEVALAALPPQLRDWSQAQLARKLRSLAKKQQAAAPDEVAAASLPLTLNAEQQQALVAMGQAQLPVLLFGATGSGKTEVYMQAVSQLLQAQPTAQALILVPEINLTPQLESVLRQRFAHWGAQALVSMHSGMTLAERSNAWLAAHSGQARIVLGTRLSVFASFVDLRMIVVDEEHDASYKAQDGARHSARDLAVYRAQLETRRLQQTEAASAACLCVLGSATPSLESWQAAAQGRYLRLNLQERIGQGRLARIKLVDMRLQPRGTIVAPSLVAAIAERAARGEQSLLLLNRRGYAPVLSCGACEWKSACPHCSAFRVFHKVDRSLRCHHCGFSERVPRACPECGNVDIAPLGRGTEQLEEEISRLLADTLRADGQPVRIARMDADSTKGKDGLQQHLADMHSGAVDVLVGTQMVAKGHDFRRITLVAAINPDGGLFSSDFRAPERLCALLMQAAGRAGRDAALSASAQMWVQTQHTEHPLYHYLAKHDWAGFAQSQLQEREAAAMPPFGFQALLRAEAKTQETAQAFLQAAGDLAAGMAENVGITLYSPVPMPMQRIANVERAQLLLECESRIALQRFLSAWRAQFGGIGVKGVIRWALDVDPASV